jgi:hypothetical protein
MAMRFESLQTRLLALVLAPGVGRWCGGDCFHLA